MINISHKNVDFIGFFAIFRNFKENLMETQNIESCNHCLIFLIKNKTKVNNENIKKYAIRPFRDGSNN